MNTLPLQVARLESYVNHEKSQQMEALWHDYNGACDQGFEEEAANYARQIRNKLLEETDAQMALDRLSLPIPTSTPTWIEDWLPFLRALGEVLSGDWAKYRQELRDLPSQEGWPFNIQFPEKPTK